MEPFAVFCHDDDTVSEKRRQKRVAVAVIPAMYVGARVTPALYAALVAMYGTVAVTRARIKSGILFDDFDITI